MKAIVFLILLSFGMTNHQTPKKWGLAKNKNGVKVYVSPAPNSDYYAFKAVMPVTASPTKIVRILKDVNNYPKWFAYTASTKLTSQTAKEQYFFMETDYPWPFSNECMNYSMEFIQLTGGKQKITINGTTENTSCKYALKKANGYILLEPTQTGTQVSYYFHCEPSQNIPTWLINPRIHEMPYQTFIGLKKQLSN